MTRLHTLIASFKLSRALAKRRRDREAANARAEKGWETRIHRQYARDPMIAARQQ